MLKSRFNKNNIKITYKNNINVEIYGSQILFSHIIINLLSNAIDSYDQKEGNLKSFKKITILSKIIKNNIIIRYELYFLK